MTTADQPEPTTTEGQDNDEIATHPLDAEEKLLASLAPPDLQGEYEGVEDGLAHIALEQLSISDLDSASWAARHLTRKRARIAEIRALAAEQRFRIDAYEAGETKKLEADATFFEGRLQAFHMQVLQADPRAKTLPLPDGTELRSQAGKLAVEVTDLEAFQAWADMNEMTADVVDDEGNVVRPGLFRLADPEPNKTTIGKVLGGKAAAETEPGEYPAIVGESGETVPGVVIVRKARTYTIGTPT